MNNKLHNNKHIILILNKIQTKNNINNNLNNNKTMIFSKIMNN